MTISFTHSFNGRLVTQEEPWIMAILNATPDSFFAHSRVSQQAVDRAGEMLEQGAHILDIGGQSTRPGATRIEANEEIDRVVPLVEAIHQAFPNALLSIDTFYGSVVKAVQPFGISMVNDVSAGQIDETLLPTTAQLGLPYVLMHMQGEPQSMQKAPTYTHVTQEVIKFISQKINELRLMGIGDVWIDPGFGFGKTLEHNYTLLEELEQLHIFQCPLLVGVSRKKMIQNAVNRSAEEVIYGTTAVHMAALERGASILRVHDVEPARQAIAIQKQLLEAKKKAKSV